MQNEIHHEQALQRPGRTAALGALAATGLIAAALLPAGARAERLVLHDSTHDVTAHVEAQQADPDPSESVAPSVAPAAPPIAAAPTPGDAPTAAHPVAQRARRGIGGSGDSGGSGDDGGSGGTGGGGSAGSGSDGDGDSASGVPASLLTQLFQGQTLCQLGYSGFYSYVAGAYDYWRTMYVRETETGPESVNPGDPSVKELADVYHEVLTSMPEPIHNYRSCLSTRIDK